MSKKSAVKCELYLDAIIGKEINKNFIVDMIEKHRRELDLFLKECVNNKENTYHFNFIVPFRDDKTYSFSIWRSDGGVLDINIYIQSSIIASFHILENGDNVVDELINVINKKMDELTEKLLS